MYIYIYIYTGTYVYDVAYSAEEAESGSQAGGRQGQGTKAPEERDRAAAFWGRGGHAAFQQTFPKRMVLQGSGGGSQAGEAEFAQEAGRSQGGPRRGVRVDEDSPEGAGARQG